jgi:hypothetical protein
MHRSFLFALILVFGAVDLPAQEQAKTPAKELTQYIRDAQKAGLKDAEIQQSAVKSGWPEQLVTEALTYIHTAANAPPVKAEPPTVASPVAAPKTAVDATRPAPDKPTAAAFEARIKRRRPIKR